MTGEEKMMHMYTPQERSTQTLSGHTHTQTLTCDKTTMYRTTSGLYVCVFVCLPLGTGSDC